MIWLFVLLLALAAGLLIGFVGIGGIVLVPALSIGGFPIHEAIAASMCSYLFAATVASVIYARRGSIARSSAILLGAGAAPGSFAGTMLVNSISADVVLLVIGLATVFSGVQLIAGKRRHRAPATDEMSRPALVTLGAAVGVGSALTGTGGPAILVPLLAVLGFPILTVVGLSQTIQIPIAAVATATNLLEGHINFALAVSLGVGLAVGAGVGARIAHALPRVILERGLGFVLLAIGGELVARNPLVMLRL